VSTSVTQSPSKMSLELSLAFPLSPQSSIAENADYWDSAPALSNPPEAFVTSDPIRNRKRRLSDADSYPTPKRPRGLAVGPRPHAVSDPLPPSNGVSEALDLDNWFQFNFDIPDPVTAEDLDPSTPIEVELFKDWTLLGGDMTESLVQSNECM
jgi:hypothetical protein